MGLAATEPRAWETTSDSQHSHAWTDRRARGRHRRRGGGREDDGIPRGRVRLLLRDVELPATAVGSLTLKPCAECDPITLRAAPATEYSFIGGAALPLRDFLAQVAHLRETGRDGSTGVGVFYDLASKRLTRVVVVPAN